jgi:serine/threonine protein phosphatase PrpC
VTDRGLRHTRNEDALFLETISGASVVAVVCDGVSCSARPDDASQAAADAAGRMLAAAVASGAEDLTASMADAIDEAQAAVAATSWTPTDGLPAPSSTLASAVCHAGTVTIGWVGDSRAYWFGSNAERLTVDDSWAGEEVQAGLMTEAEADADPRAHSITAWLGADAPEGPRHVATFTPEGSGRLLVCSDGLWNYAPTATGLAELVAAQADDASALAVARSLTDFALAAGGRDNITVVIVDLAGSGDGAKGAT